MPADASISFWIDQLKAGDQNAAQPLWDRYFQELVRLARQRLAGAARAVADEEDVALSAFTSFCKAAEAGRFPQLSDRDDLWRLLIVITERKALTQMRDQARLKRGGGAAHAAAGMPATTTPQAPDLGQVAGREPTPLFAALMAEQCERLLGALDSDILRAVALDKMEGFNNEEIATRRSLALRTVERKLALIRRIWEQEFPEGIQDKQDS
jgi:DNA-directed RNA polymerase specialized sigma24 family protein